MQRLVVHFSRFGPYHHARVHSAWREMALHGWEIVGLETAGKDNTYAWDELSARKGGPRVTTAFPNRTYDDLGKGEMWAEVQQVLDELKPEAVAIAGWSLTDSRSCLAWCRKHGAKAIVMSETREADGHRVGWKEFLKSRIIRRFDAALVGGKSHRDYLVKLGLPVDRIRLGYNVVDNAYFAAEAAKYRSFGDYGSGFPTDRESEADGPEGRKRGGFPPSEIHHPSSTLRSSPYFLASNRFIERKNLACLVEAYALYTESPNHRITELPAWSLCLLGDGELKADLIAQCQALGLQVAECAPWEQVPPSAIQHPTSTIVYFPGFRQIEELPRFYARAGCFVHPALEEPWGLVLNEAMACGLPVLSGSNVGAVESLIDVGVNGWTFDAENSAEMAECLRRISGLNEGERIAMGAASTRILEEHCPTKAFGQGLAELLREEA